MNLQRNDWIKIFIENQRKGKETKSQTLRTLLDVNGRK